MNERSDSGPPPDGAPGAERELQPSWQTEFRHTAESEHLQRLLADLELINTLRITGFTGPAYEELAKALAEYGYQVIGSWIRTGAIYRKLAEKGKAHYLARHPKRIPPTSDAAEMTRDVVADALVAFRRDVLLPGTWDHRKGASLATFFIGQCLLRFPRVYVEWLKSDEYRSRCVAPEDLQKRQPATTSGYDDPARVAAIRSGLAEARELAPQVTREILLLTEEGYSHPEIAAILGTTVGAIESRLHRHYKACERRRLNDTA